MRWQSLPPVFERYTVDANGCWIWPHVRNDGYGRIKKDGKTWTAHRFFYVHLVGPIPDGLTLDHLCFQPLCVNPEHLRILSREANSARQRSAMKSACVNGHEFTPENTYRAPTGRRVCRACNRRRAREYQTRRRAE